MSGNTPIPEASGSTEAMLAALVERGVLTREEDVEAVQAVKNAWTVPGPHMAFHRQAQAHLRATWPVLANALDRLTDWKEDN